MPLLKSATTETRARGVATQKATDDVSSERQVCSQVLDLRTVSALVSFQRGMGALFISLHNLT